MRKTEEKKLIAQTHHNNEEHWNKQIRDRAKDEWGDRQAERTSTIAQNTEPQFTRLLRMNMETDKGEDTPLWQTEY